MTIPYIGFGNEQLEKQPIIRDGDGIICPHCGDVHHVQAGTDMKTGEKTDSILSYTCGAKTYLAGVSGKLVIGAKADCSGKI